MNQNPKVVLDTEPVEFRTAQEPDSKRCVSMERIVGRR